MVPPPPFLLLDKSRRRLDNFRNAAFPRVDPSTQIYRVVYDASLLSYKTEIVEQTELVVEGKGNETAQPKAEDAPMLNEDDDALSEEDLYYGDRIPLPQAFDNPSLLVFINGRGWFLSEFIEWERIRDGQGKFCFSVIANADPIYIDADSDPFLVFFRGRFSLLIFLLAH